MTIKAYPLDNGTLKVKYHLHKIGEQKPYFSITADLMEGGVNVACGCLHTEIAEHCPELKELLPYHLASNNGLPMHYVANALYWRDGVWKAGRYTPDQKPEECKRILLDHIRYGTVEGDKDTDPCILTREELKTWLEGRIDALKVDFDAMMAKHNVIVEN